MTQDARAIGLGFLERLPLARKRRWLAYCFAVLASGAALVLRWQIDAVLPPGFPFLTFFPAVILTAFLFGIGPGILAAVLSGLAARFWFIPPMGFMLAYDSAVALAFYVVIVVVDIALIHWMQRATHHLALERRRADDLVSTREALFNELQHRVGNNLQMVASLLSLQRRGVTEPAAAEALADASRRVAVVGRIQRNLYSAQGEQLDLAPYLEAIVRDTIEAAGREDIEVSFSNTLGRVSLAPAAAIPAALVLAESVSNAVEHGFADQGGEIAVSLRRDERCYVIEVEDDGRGLPADFQAASTESLGLRIARTLASGQGGGFDLEPGADGHGALATIRIACADGEQE